MNWFPQIGAGSVAQFPLMRVRKWRAFSNELEGGERILLPDAGADQIEWRLMYRDLSDSEAQNLSGLFTASRGEFGTFTFIDPLANLLGWSEELRRPDWQTGLLENRGNAGDPIGTLRAATLANPTSGAQSITQTLGISGDYVVCFSAYVRSAEAAAITIARDGRQVIGAVGPLWTRIWISGAGMAGTGASAFSILVAAGQTVDVWGLQVEAQPYPSPYKVTAAPRGIYQETGFGSDEFNMTSEGVGLSSCSITLVSRV